MAARSRSLSRREVLRAGASALGLAALAGCGAGPHPVEAPTGPPEGPISLLTPIFQGADGKKLLESRLLPVFQRQYPQVSVSVDYADYDILDAKITTDLTSGASPDVIMLGVGWVEPFAARGVLAELVAPPGESLPTGYTDQVLQSCRYGGKLYALPVSIDTRFGFYRKDILAGAGLTRPPETMDELRGYAIELTARRDGKLVRTGLDILTLDPRFAFETVLFAFGGGLFHNGQPAFDDPTGVAALEWMTGLMRADRVIDPGFSNPKTMSPPIVDGRAAMAIGHNNWWLYILDGHPEMKDLIVPFLLNQRQPSMFAGGALVSVSAASRRPAAAQALARYLASPPVSLAAAQQRGNVPALESLRDTAYVRGDPFVQFALANLGYARPEGGSPAWLRVRSEVKAAVESALLGRRSPRQALDALAVVARAALADFGPN